MSTTLPSSLRKSIHLTGAADQHYCTGVQNKRPPQNVYFYHTTQSHRWHSFGDACSLHAGGRKSVYQSCCLCTLFTNTSHLQCCFKGFASTSNRPYNCRSCVTMAAQGPVTRTADATVCLYIRGISAQTNWHDTKNESTLALEMFGKTIVS